MREFVYDGRSFPDPDPTLTVDEVRQHMANFFPELSNASSSESKRGEDTVITLTKRVGTKGVPFTDEVKKKYIAASGEICPYCDGQNVVSTGENEEYLAGYDAQMECSDCGKHWLDLYKLVSIAEMGDDVIIP